MYKQSESWDMNITLEELIKSSLECRVDRDYDTHWSDNGFKGMCIFLKHPNSDSHTTIITIGEDGFCYDGDISDSDNYIKAKTKDILDEMVLYGEYIKKKDENMFEEEFGEFRDINEDIIFVNRNIMKN